MSRPQHGWSSPCVVDRVLDGDTIEVTVTRKLRVRLLGCWAPEIHGEEKPLGLKSLQHLKELALGSTGTVFIPTEDARNMGDILTLGRVLGHVWIDGSDISLSDAQVIAGHARREKV